MKSVLQDWVMELPLREQGTLLTGIRGCDLTPKLPLDSTERHLVAFLRFCVLNPADPREVGILPGCFFQAEPPAETWKFSELGHYPLHYVSHLMHCFEVVAYRHPGEQRDSTSPKVMRQAMAAYRIYEKMVRGLHLNVETRPEMIARLSEDRIANGTVVS